MSATIAQAREIVARYRWQRVCIRFEASDEAWYADGQRDAYILEGTLGRALITLRGGSAPWGFVIFGRRSDWRKCVDRYRDDPETYAEARRAFVRPANHPCAFHLADRIEPAPHKAAKPTRRQCFGFDKQDASALAAEVAAAMIARAKRGAP